MKTKAPDAPPTESSGNELVLNHFASIQAFGTDLAEERPGQVLNWFRQLVTLLGITAFHGSLSFIACLCVLLTVRFVFFTQQVDVIGILCFIAAITVGGLIGVLQLTIVSRYEEYPFHLL
ncbi:MAG: hypothetical protein ACF8AM_22425, partial [Rhodopirellula sp. JB055]